MSCFIRILDILHDVQPVFTCVLLYEIFYSSRTGDQDAFFSVFFLSFFLPVMPCGSPVITAAFKCFNRAAAPF